MTPPMTFVMIKTADKPLESCHTRGVPRRAECRPSGKSAWVVSCSALWGGRPVTLLYGCEPRTNSCQRWVADEPAGLSRMQLSTKAEKLAENGAGFAAHHARISGNESHQAVVADQRSHTSLGMARACA